MNLTFCCSKKGSPNILAEEIGTVQGTVRRTNKQRGEILTNTHTHALIAVFIVSLMLLSTMAVPATQAASPTAISNAITKGLAYLAANQNPDGSWSGYPVASTAMAVLAFENEGFYGWNSSSPYHTTVQAGLNWLFSEASVQTINSANSAGNPDVSGDGYGIAWYFDGYYNSVYETPMVLAAIVASNAPTNVTTVGPTGVVGLTYKHVAQDIVDWIAWAQNSKPGCCGIYEGGWRYSPQYGQSDNSVSQWPVMGLLAAKLWGVSAPSWVATELQKWIISDQDLTGTPNTNPYYGAFDYLPGYTPAYIVSPAESAAGILQLTYVGAASTNASLLAAEGYLYRDWLTGTPGDNPGGCSPVWGCGFNYNIGALYDMYAVMKAMRSTTPTPTTFILNYTKPGSIEWYNGHNEYADALVGNQSADGHWNNWVNWAENDDVSDNLGTAWGTLILEPIPVRVTYTLEVDVVDNVGNPISGATVSAVGPTTQGGTTGADGKVVFKNIQGGTYTVAASEACYVSASQVVALTTDTKVTLTLLPGSCISVPEFGASSLIFVTAICVAVVLFMGFAKPMRSRKQRTQTDTQK